MIDKFSGLDDLRGFRVSDNISDAVIFVQNTKLITFCITQATNLSEEDRLTVSDGEEVYEMQTSFIFAQDKIRTVISRGSFDACSDFVDAVATVVFSKSHDSTWNFIEVINSAKSHGVEELKGKDKVQDMNVLLLFPDSQLASFEKLWKNDLTVSFVLNYLDDTTVDVDFTFSFYKDKDNTDILAQKTS